MWQRLRSFALPTGFAVLGALWMVAPTAAQAQTNVNYNFEDGQLRGDPTKMQVPPKILSENGNEFMRITGSSGDKQSIPASKPNRNRSTVEFTSHYTDMPTISEANRRQTYSAKMRYTKQPQNSGVNFELFQGAPGGEGGYGTRNGTGPVIQGWRKTDGHVIFRANYANETKWDSVDMGYVALNSWHTYTVKAIWSHDPKQGRIEIYFDGKLKKTISGRDTNLGPDSNRLPMFKLGMYGDYAVGVIDVDNVQALPTPAPTPSVALSAPTNIRLVSGQ